MAKIKLVQADRTFLPDVEFPTDKGMMNNRDMDDSDQVKAEITLASIGQKSKYIGTYSTTDKKKKGESKSFVDFNYSACLMRHCDKITGLEEYKVTNGIDIFTAAKNYPVMNDIIQDIFLKINGVHPDDDSEDSDGGELTEGED